MDDDVAITDEMIEAGVKAIGLYLDDSGPRYMLREAAKDCFRAMLAVMPNPPPPPASEER